jgi:ABC-type ATPase involved in cell division
VLEHVAMPLIVDGRDHRGAARRAHETLAACEADQCAGMMLKELSDGERQRVEIARAIVIEPRLLIADAPARGLSFVEQERIMALLHAFAHEARRAVLITDTEANALIRADPLLYLQGGRLVNAPIPAKPGNVYEFPGRSRQAAADA